MIDKRYEKKLNSRDFWMRKAYKPLRTKYDWVIAQRIKNDKDKKPIKYNRIDKAIFRHPNLWEDLTRADFID